jgi:hypothetical protein
MKAGRRKKIKISARFLIILLMFSLQSIYSQSYVPPIGIPAPEFGINETVENVYGSEDYYTHYIDNSDTNATDTDNSNGSPEMPRLTIPTNVPAGSVVEIHGGPYNNLNTTWSMNGTLEEPVFLRGVSDSLRPRIKKSELWFNGQYFIVENLDFYDKSRIKFRTTAKYGTLRNSEVHNPIGQTGAGNPTISLTGEHIVAYNNEVHDNIREENIDCHGFQASNEGLKIWILENNIYNNGGDGIQACHACNPGPRYLYIGGNDIHGDKENGIDLKYARDVIISQNKLHDYNHSAATGIVSPIVIGSDGAPTRVWVLFNEIYDAKRGIRIEEIENLWIIGNLIYDITETGIIPEKQGTETYVIHNTLFNMNRGISNPWRVDFGFFIYNNIFSNINTRSINLGSAILEKSEINTNLFWNARSDGENQINQDPLFTDAENFDFGLQESSPAIDAGMVVGGILHDYYRLYGVDISVDFLRELRPQGNNLDIGAFEFPTGTFPVQYELEADVEGLGGNVWPTGGKFVTGSKVKITATPIEEYAFNYWTGDLSSSVNPDTVIMDSDISISAVFKAQTHYSLSIDISGNGSVSRNPDSSHYAPGTVVTLTAIPGSGEQFIEWRGDLAGTDTLIQITVDGNKDVNAIFTSPLSEEYIINAIGPYSDRFEASWSAYATADYVDGVIGFSKVSPTEYNHLSCKILFNNMGDITASNGSGYTADESVSYTAYQTMDFRMSVDMDAQTYSVWVTPEGGSEILLANTYAFHPAPGDIDQIGYRSVKMAFGGDYGGAEGMVEIINFDVVLGIKNESGGPKIPSYYSLSSYPNPFNPSTTIRYTLPQSGDLKLTVFDIKGRKVVDLFNGHQKAGDHKLTWHAVDANGGQLASGVYILHMTGDGFSQTGKLMLLK